MRQKERERDKDRDRDRDSERQTERQRGSTQREREIKREGGWAADTHNNVAGFVFRVTDSYLGLWNRTKVFRV